MNKKTISLFLFSLLNIFPFETTYVHAQKSQKDIPFIKAEPAENYLLEQQQKKQEEESRKTFEAQQQLMIKSFRINNYKFILNDDIFKFSFLISTIIAIVISIFKWKINKLEFYLPFSVLVSFFILHAFFNSEIGEFFEYAVNGFKSTFITILLSMIMVGAYVNILRRRNNFTSQQKTFIAIASFVLTGFAAYILTMNIELENYHKPAFITYPWNWISFFILNIYLYYRLKLVES